MSYEGPEDRIATVGDALIAINVPGLNQLAALVCSDRLPTRKAELVALVSTRLAHDDVLRDTWERLDDIQQAAVAEVVHGHGPRFEHDRFLAKYGRSPDWGTLDNYPRRSTGPTALRLFFFGGRTMPDDLRDRLRAFVPAPADAVLATLDGLPAAIERRWTVLDPAVGKRREEAEEVPLEVRETERAAMQDLETVLRLVESGKLAVSDKTRRPTAATIRLMADALAEGDFYAQQDDGVGPIKAFAWPMLVQAGGLAELRGTRLALTKAGVKALGAEAASVIALTWRRWLGTRILDELARVEAIRGQTGNGKRGLTAPAGRRDAIADALAECPPGRWVASDELFRHMRAAGHRFEVTRNAWTLYICEAGYGSLGYDGCGWKILEVRYALCLLFEYAATLGLIDVAYVTPAGARPDYHDLWGTDGLEYLSRYDGLEYLRLTALGAWCLGVTDAYEPTKLDVAPAFTILANLELTVTGTGLTPADRLVLERYAEQTSDRVWRLGRDKLLAAAEKGESPADVQEFLAARSFTPLPAVVVSLLEDVAERTERLVDRGSMRVIECADPALVALLANDSKTRSLCTAAGKDRLLVPTACEPAFRRAVRKLGYAVRSGEQTRAAA